MLSPETQQMFSPLVQVELFQDHRPDLRGHIADGAGGEGTVVQPDAVARVGPGVVDEHGGGHVHPSVDHLREEVVLHGAGRLRALVVPDLTVPHAAVPHGVEDLGVVAVGEHQDGGVGLDHRQEAAVRPGDVQDADGGQVNGGVVGEILQPGQNALVVENAHSRLLSAGPGGAAVRGCRGHSTGSTVTAAFFFRKAAKVAGSPWRKPSLRSIWAALVSVKRKKCPPSSLALLMER